MTPAERAGWSVGFATGLYGISFGALAVASGLSALQAIALSALMFTGGSQFAWIGVVGAGGSGAAATGAATLLGVRNTVYAMRLSTLVPPRSLTERATMAQLTIDESTAVAVGQESPDERRRGFWAAGWGVYLFWVAFSALGAVAGDRIGDLRALGLDGAAVAAFTGLLWPHLRDRRPVAVAVLAAVVTLALVPAVPAGLPILGAALVAAIAGWLARPADLRGAVT
ncbi:AzlC family ABC transporter permease [Kytococcus sedentarius]|uniref:AzlC family ABC transporter permease n=1 Tax=Kytococcus sedentarius TaxID=1276 RepID=UPI0035BC03F1